MIIINIKGGLGNQLFQIYTGISYSLDNKLDFRICDCHFDNQDINTTKRNTYWDFFFKNINKKVIKNNENFIKIKEKKFEYDPIPKLENCILIGYYQSYKYFESNFEKINKIIGIRKQQENIRNKYKFDYKNLCSIHFRLGDYKLFSDCHLILEKNYYLKATELMVKYKKSFLVFYEKEDWESVNKIIKYIQEKNTKIREIIFIDTTIEDSEQLLIMSCCHSNIIANSSFSWWSAYLNNSKDKIVVRPDKWFGPKMSYKNLKDLCPSDWNII